MEEFCQHAAPPSATSTTTSEIVPMKRRVGVRVCESGSSGDGRLQQEAESQVLRRLATVGRVETIFLQAAVTRRAEMPQQNTQP